MVKSNFQLRVKVILDGFGFYLNLALTGLKSLCHPFNKSWLEHLFSCTYYNFFFTLIVDCCDIFLCSDQPL